MKKTIDVLLRTEIKNTYTQSQKEAIYKALGVSESPNKSQSTFKLPKGLPDIK